MSIAEYIRLLGKLFHGEAVDIVVLWDSLPAEQRQEFLARCLDERAAPFAYQRLFSAGIREGLGELQKKYVRYSANITQHMVELARFTKVLEVAGIRYALIKGADLAFRIYPSPTLRPFSDWDVLFHYDDLPKALEIIKQDGWELTAPLSTADMEQHHYPLCTRRGMSMEPHWTLPMFNGCTPMEIWNKLEPQSEGSCRYILSAPMNMLLLARHTAETSYNDMPLAKMLLDAQYLLQAEGFNWEACRQLAEELHLPYPGDLLAAFPEFFSAEDIHAMHADTERSKAYREIFEQREALSGKSLENWQLNSSKAFSENWFKQRLEHCSFRVIRLKYNLPPECPMIKLCGLFLWDALKKCSRCIRLYLFRDQDVMSQMERIAKAEGQKHK